MEHIYSVHQKEINGVPTYFIKKFLTFPEQPGMPDIREGFGMHSNFDMACTLAGIDCNRIKSSLREQVDVVVEGKVIPLQPEGRSIPMIR
ncbi:MAG TPA: hypothetical protein PKY29_05780 [Ferruginibacter sp.]|nr:hypothetical protein [Ferruginibacter sp.]HRO17878.1 hypothetical protein [Ferruginibacter sp.]HRQ20805.1 hypothetical protein [Ferruginibacter sp.]